jgi:hypothetical protein
LLVVGRVNVGVADDAGTVSVNLPDAVADAIANDPVLVPGIPRTGAIVAVGAPTLVPVFPTTVPPAILVRSPIASCADTKFVPFPRSTFPEVAAPFT